MTKAKRTPKRTLILMLVSLSLLVSVLGCGSASNNDQGVSFTNEGYWVYDQEDEEWDFTDRAFIEVNPDSIPDSFPQPQLILGMRVGNKLSTQFISVKRVDCRYDIPGADVGLRIPSDSHSVSKYLPHAGYDDSEPHPDDSDVASTQHAMFPALSSNMMQFISVNQNSLPEVPFFVVATCSAVGVTQAGDTLTTNAESYEIEVIEDRECCTGPFDEEGFQRGEGTGGDADTYDPNGDDETTGNATEDATTSDGSTEETVVEDTSNQ